MKHIIEINRCQLKAPHGGAVLIIVMWITFGLVTIALFLGHSMYLEYRGAEQFHEGNQAEQAIQGALRYFQFVLTSSEEAGNIPDTANYTSQFFQIGEATVYLIGRSGDTTLQSSSPTFGPIDEASKININTAPIEVLQSLPMITQEFAAALIDWRDEDDDVTENGAESSMYSMMANSYSIKNAPFETVDELRLVFGATTEMLYGEDTNQNGILDPNENDGDLTPPADNGDGVLDFGLIEYVTVYASEPDADTAAAGENNDGNTNPPGNNTNPPGGAARLQQQPPPTEQDSSTTNSFKVNVNSASSIVLACIPGLDESSAQQLVAARTGNTEANPTIDWIRDVLSAEALAQAEPYLTDKAYQFTLDVAAVGRRGQGYRRVRFIIDNSDGAALVRHRKDMSRYGWALGESIRQQFRTSTSSSNSR
ncbi:MAG: type II secretion system protein GspK [Verrucomicrobia bacterium]|nr:type II secretion system protein GspK [Verrucomicrobiota bacterium]